MIVLVRHGRTDANARGLLLGRADPALDHEGRLQAARLAAAPGRSETRVVSSPLARCRQTAELIVAASEHDVPLDVDEAWIELDYGAFDGLGAGDVPADTWAAWRADVAWAPEGGESLAAPAPGSDRRVRPWRRRPASGRGRGDACVAREGGGRGALGVGDEVAWRMWVGPASISRIGFVGSSPSLRSFNEVAHLT